MIICNSKKFIYIHIPKCGGTTVSSVLERNLLPQDISLNLSPHSGWGEFINAYRKKFGLFKHSTAAEIERAMKPNHFKEYFTFTFCRNPFARAYSAYTFTLRSDARHRPDSERYRQIKNMSFEKFLQSKYVQNQELLQTKAQCHWLQGSGQKVHIYKLEDVGNALAGLAEYFYGENKKGFTVPRKNKSTQMDEWKSMSPKAEEIILGIYAKDFEILGYDNHIER